MKITLINNVLPENLFNTKKELLTRRLGAHIQIQCHNTSDTTSEWVEVESDTHLKVYDRATGFTRMTFDTYITQKEAQYGRH